MANEFKPFDTGAKQDEFSVWNYQLPQKEEPPEVDQEALFLQECERIKQEAFAKGYEEGLQQGQVEINARKIEFAKWIELLQEPVKLLDEQLIQEVISALIHLSQYCIGVELSVHPEKLRALLDVIKNELPALQGDKSFAMHPLDVEWIKANIKEEEIAGLHDALIADPSLARGDFHLKGSHTEVDGKIQTRLLTLFAKYVNKDNFLSSDHKQDLE